MPSVRKKNNSPKTETLHAEPVPTSYSLGKDEPNNIIYASESFSPSTDNDEIDDWSLTSEQMLFMLEHHNEIQLAYESQDLTTLDKLIASRQYKAVFGDMGWDEAYDRYEEFLLTEDSDANA